MSGDRITLTMPRERDFFRVAHLVVGGLAVRLDLTFENLEDLQIALATVLREAEGEVTVSVHVEPNRIEAAIGPFGPDAQDLDLDRDVVEEGVPLRRVLETVCDSVDVQERDGGRWVVLAKNVQVKTAG
jgi:anti-sigma regulatory factor (Ser/Thr protein kinase)